jgi:hypothetical protein
MDFGLSLVPGIFPVADFQRERTLVGQAPLEALAGQNAQFNLGHVQPRAMRPHVVKAQLVLSRWQPVFGALFL